MSHRAIWKWLSSFQSSVICRWIRDQESLKSLSRDLISSLFIQSKQKLDLSNVTLMSIKSITFFLESILLSSQHLINQDLCILRISIRNLSLIWRRLQQPLVKLLLNSRIISGRLSWKRFLWYKAKLLKWEFKKQRTIGKNCFPRRFEKNWTLSKRGRKSLPVHQKYPTLGRRNPSRGLFKTQTTILFQLGNKSLT